MHFLASFLRQIDEFSRVFKTFCDVSLYLRTFNNRCCRDKMVLRTGVFQWLAKSQSFETATLFIIGREPRVDTWRQDTNDFCRCWVSRFKPMVLMFFFYNHRISEMLMILMILMIWNTIMMKKMILRKTCIIDFDMSPVSHFGGVSMRFQCLVASA